METFGALSNGEATLSRKCEPETYKMSPVKMELADMMTEDTAEDEPKLQAPLMGLVKHEPVAIKVEVVDGSNAIKQEVSDAAESGNELEEPDFVIFKEEPNTDSESDGASREEGFESNKSTEEMGGIFSSNPLIFDVVQTMKSRLKAVFDTKEFPEYLSSKESALTEKWKGSCRVASPSIAEGTSREAGYKKESENSGKRRHNACEEEPMGAQEENTTHEGQNQESSSTQSPSKLRRKQSEKKKPFCCETCGKTFRFNSDFQPHIRTHTGEKPFQCSVCDKAFLRKGHLVVHMRAHTKERPYTCSICQQKYFQKTHLITHMRIHTGEKPFKCDYCEAAFSRKETLNQHVAVHKGVRPFLCTDCGKRFTHFPILTDHMQRIHGNISPICNEQEIVGAP